MKRLFSEGGINWCWFTALEDHEDGTVTILWHERFHKGDEWPKELYEATNNPHYHSSNVWREESGRIATHYSFDDGWRQIRNPAYIFSYRLEAAA